MVARIERVPLREVWSNEATEFTPWLEENIGILGEELGLDLTVVEREKATFESGFSVDLVVSDENGRTIIIENQLKKSDHDHLGKLITYLTAMEARAAVWIVADARPEHVEAVNWLNESGQADFYLYKLEAVRIGNSEPAPLLTRILGPSKEMRSIGSDKQEISEVGRKRLMWWEKLIQHTDAKKDDCLAEKAEPHASPWWYCQTGIYGVYFVYMIRKEESGVSLEIDRGECGEEKALDIFDVLDNKKEEIEEAFDGKLCWDRDTYRSGSRISVIFQERGYDSPEDEWEVSQGKLIETMHRLRSAIGPHLDKINS